jgi:hypothetical protein
MLAWVAVLLLGCRAGHVDAPASRDVLRVESERPLAPAEHAFVDGLRKKLGKGEVDHQWIARVDGAPVRLAGGWTLDVQQGSGHGGALEFLRIVLSEGTASLERIEGAGQSVTRGMPPLTTTVQRATVPRAEIDALLEPCGALATIAVERRRIPDAPSDGSGSISIDVYLLVRIHDARGRVVVDRHYVGYLSEDGLVGLWPLEVATKGLLAYVERISSWTEVPESEQRGCHLTAAFDENRAVMTGDFAWFVQERSLEMLAQAGNRGAIPTLEWLAAREPDDSSRRNRKIATLLADPGRWLEGPPRDLYSAE